MARQAWYYTDYAWVLHVRLGKNITPSKPPRVVNTLYIPNQNMARNSRMKPKDFAAVDSPSRLISDDGELDFIKRFLQNGEALQLFRRLLSEIDWVEESIDLFGRTVPVPRKICWYGDPGSDYTYSGVLHTPQAWTPILARLKSRLETETGRHFNSVLGNLYQNGRDSMGWHADKEPELGDTPFIASLSFGESRTFLMRHNKTKEIVKIDLSNGSLLLMGGSVQKHWRHCVPKTTQAKQARINLTFRRIFTHG